MSTEWTGDLDTVLSSSLGKCLCGADVVKCVECVPLQRDFR